MKTKVVYTPPVSTPPPRPPSWWKSFFKETGTVVEHDGARWILLESYSWADYNGRSWYLYTPKELPSRRLTTDEEYYRYKEHA